MLIATDQVSLQRIYWMYYKVPQKGETSYQRFLKFQKRSQKDLLYDYSSTAPEKNCLNL